MDGKIRKSKGKFFIPVFVLRDKFKGKFLYHLNALYQSGILKVPFSLSEQEAYFCWNTFKDSLYQKDWCPYIKKHSMGLVMQSNILDAIPTRLLSLTAGSFLSRKSKNLKLIFKLQGYQKFKQRYASLGMTDLLSASWGFDSP